MNKREIIERLKNIAGHAVHTVGEKPLIMSLDDGIAVHEAIELLKKSETNCSEFPNNWIPCSERLPNKFEDVWVTDNCGRVAVCRMGHTGWRDMESDEWMYHLDSIVAWMPYNAPEPYQEGGKQNGTEK